MFLLHYDQSSVISIHHRRPDPNALDVDFEQVIVSVILFTVLFANQIMICAPAAHVSLVLSCLLNSSATAAGH